MIGSISKSRRMMSLCKWHNSWDHIQGNASPSGSKDVPAVFG